MVKKFQDRNSRGQFTEVGLTPPQNIPHSMDDIPKISLNNESKQESSNSVFDKQSFNFKSLTPKEVVNYTRAMDFASQEVSTPASKAAVLLQRTIIEERFGAINWAA